jgi:hypothetical protein
MNGSGLWYNETKEKGLKLHFPQSNHMVLNEL